ncbi:amidohydrolase [Microlunatus parietis]|uniref:Amidohydrolase 3 domain-containing protein n=1 Tax=Microlunatus parietis TaxID=682979 RepID=A0A7Y9I5D0_9ACTN|nr:amidohydrolase [Microlunatus parietis]NYE70593.1 hypothetical protein [Microlunatus parietis]
MDSEQVLLRNVRPLGSGEPTELLIIDGVLRPGREAGQAAGPIREVDLDGRTVLRGLWDSHVHFGSSSSMQRQLDLTRTGSAADVIIAVAERLAEQPPDPVIIGYGFRDANWPERPTRAALDRVAPDRPVVLASNDLHCCWLNTAAFRHFGIAEIEDGMLREDDTGPVYAGLEKAPDEQADRWAREAAAEAAARGLVGIVELERQLNPVVWARRVAGGNRSLRVECGVNTPELPAALELGLRTGDPVPGGEGLLTMGPLKLFMDGSLNTRTAYCHERYPEPGDPKHDHGILLLPFDDLVEQLQQATGAGLECAVHAIGDRAVAITLDAFEKVGCSGRIEHAQLITRRDLPRFGRLGMIASVQPDHAVVDRDVTDRHWPDRTERAYPFRDLLAAGATLRLGSDAPVSPLDPWLTIAAAVHRSADDRPSWHPEQEIDVAAALDASTNGRARPEIGDVADLVITDLDPLTATTPQLRTMPVHATMIAGRWTWRADGEF